MSGGYCYGEQEPIENCPYCSFPCRADFVDIGVGYTQCGPYHCENCFASEIGPYDESKELTEIEKKTGWYEPNSEPGSSANVIGGKVVSHKQMEHLYRETFVGNSDYDIPGFVENWFMEMRTKQIHQEAKEIMSTREKRFDRKPKTHD